MKLGDLVRFDLSRSHGTEPGEAWVIGTMHYDANILCLASGAFAGMPINKSHCEVLSSGHIEICSRLRKRYLDAYGQHQLNPEQ
jgi:hypothetical protein